MAKKFTETERKIIDLFNNGKSFVFNGTNYSVTKCVKPTPSKGECKTDVYIEAVSSSKDKITIKISIKQTNADFVENKIKLQRAQEIFGSDTNTILASSIEPITSHFKEDYLIYFDQFGNTDPKSIKVGWRFDLVNKKGKKRSGSIILSEEQKVGVYAGTNLSSEKKDSKIDGVIVENSGVADYILIIDLDNFPTDQQTCIDNMISIRKYVADKELYFACKAVNLRIGDDMKCESKRALAVYVKWSIKSGKLTAELVFNEPLIHDSSEISRDLKVLLKNMCVTSSNFNVIEAKLDNINFYKEIVKAKK